MTAAISAIAPMAATPSATGDLVLQPGAVIDARVAQLLGNGHARIAIAGTLVDVLSEVPLVTGAVLKLAVNAAADGVRLSLVPPSSEAETVSVSAARGTVVPPTLAGAGSPKSSEVQTILPSSDPRAAALVRAMRTAAGRQGGLSPLFADLAAALGASRNGRAGGAAATLPAAIVQGAVALLAIRPKLDEALSAEDLRSAFARSGLFSENLETMAAPKTASAASAPPDLKVALRQLQGELLQWLATPDSGAEAPAVLAGAALSVTAEASELPLQGLQSLRGLPSPPLVPAAGEDGDAILRQASTENLATRQDPAPQAQRGAPHAGNMPPPYRGALPTAQPVASPTVAPEMGEMAIGHRLLAETDAALARQTLLHIASLPNSGAMAPRADTQVSRWHFEIPFAMPHGTAVAQFEIARDDHKRSEKKEGAVPIWRARFSLDVEPAGPVHASITLTGAKTNVRLWAERQATAEALRGSAPQLSSALRAADLEAGDVAVGEGAPRQNATVPGGRFLDLAT